MSIRNLLLSILFIVSVANAETRKVESPSIRVLGRKSVTVTTNEVRLSDLARITSDKHTDDEAVIGLQKILIEKAPTPGRQVTISASRVIERLRDEGVNLERVGYALPRVMTVTRAARKVTLEEITAAIEEYLLNSGRDMALERVAHDDDVFVAPGNMELRAVPFNSSKPGQMGFTMEAKVEGEPEVRFNATAAVDEWREIPVASRPIQRGTVIGARDVRMARLSMTSVPRDAAFETNNIVGLEVSNDIALGEVFRKNKLNIPPVIEAGDAVILRYKTKLLTATASGTAIDAGINGQEIRVRNSSSRKIVSGTILESGLVEVNR